MDGVASPKPEQHSERVESRSGATHLAQEGGRIFDSQKALGRRPRENGFAHHPIGPDYGNSVSVKKLE
jgi:hypothetical protein